MRIWIKDTGNRLQSLATRVFYTFQVTGRTGGRIWGGSDNVYTDDSDIATAAVHAGIMGRKL